MLSALVFSKGSVMSLVAALACMCALGCSGATEAPPPYDGGTSYGGSNDGLDDPNVGPCDEGATKDCSVTTELESGVKACWYGEQTCVDGVWNECHEIVEPEAGSEAP